MEIFVTRRNDLNGMNPPAAPIAALGNLTAFWKADSAQASPSNAQEIVKLPCIHRLDFRAIEAGTPIRSIFPSSTHRGHRNWSTRAERVATRFMARNCYRIKLPLKRVCPEDTRMWIPRGWKHPGKRPFTRLRTIGSLT